MYVSIVNQDIISKITNAINALIIVKKPKKIHANVNHAMMGNFQTTGNVQNVVLLKHVKILKKEVANAQNAMMVIM